MTQPHQGELFRLLHEMNGKIGQLQGSVGTFVEQMKVHDTRSTELEVRMRKAEEGLSSARGARHVISAIVSAIVAFVVAYFGGGHYSVK